MKKEIKKDGNSHKIRLNSEDMRIYKLKTGDIIDLEFIKVRRKHLPVEGRKPLQSQGGLKNERTNQSSNI